MYVNRAMRDDRCWTTYTECKCSIRFSAQARTSTKNADVRLVSRPTWQTTNPAARHRFAGRPVHTWWCYRIEQKPASGCRWRWVLRRPGRYRANFYSQHASPWACANLISIVELRNACEIRNKPILWEFFAVDDLLKFPRQAFAIATMSKQLCFAGWRAEAVQAVAWDEIRHPEP
jgi:hypothetical protein